MTGTMYLSAMRQASTATQKQSPGVAAQNGNGRFGVASEHALAANRLARSWWADRWKARRAECRRSPEAVRVMTARPKASVFSAMPGPEVVVIASAPAKAAPMEEVIAAISSSAWKVSTPKSL